MNSLKKFAVAAILILLGSLSLSAQQNTMLSTTTTAAINDSQNTLQVVSATGILFSANGVNQTVLYIDRELMNVVNVTGTVITVARGAGGTRSSDHLSGALVIFGRPTWFAYTQQSAGNVASGRYDTTDPAGSCVLANQPAQVYINVYDGLVWQCSNAATPNRWVPYFGNPGTPGTPIAISPTVASAAGVITPSGVLFHVSGTMAITGFTLPFGYHGGNFCVIPDGAFTWTTAGNIALAGTAVVNKTLCFSYDASAAKPFTPSYIN
jgi:hypothetical protein